MALLDNIIRIKDKSYYVDNNLRYLITKVFCNPSTKINISDANDYLGLKNGKEGIIWASAENNTIIICSNNDKGTLYKPKNK